jgi:alpha-tubulin suppressor-like RCC1 family protein
MRWIRAKGFWISGVLWLWLAAVGTHAETVIAFGPAVEVPAVAGISELAVGDLDGDGWPDLLASQSSSNCLALFRNLGATNPPGTFHFSAPVLLSCPTNPSSLTIADLNGDRRPELVVGIRDAVALFENRSVPGTLDEASFALAAILPPDPSFSSARAADIQVADYDGDGVTDLVAATRHGAIWRNLALGGAITPESFAPPLVLTNSTSSLGLLTADFDGNGLSDVVLAGGSRLFLNWSRPAALEFELASVGVPLWGLADVDSDGLPDLHSSSSMFLPSELDVRVNQSTPGHLQWGEWIEVAGLPGPVQGVDDLDGDGRGDFLLRLSTTNLGVIRNPYLPGTVGRCDLGPAATVAPSAGLWHEPALVFADLDTDGRKDYVRYVSSPPLFKIFPNLTVSEPEVWLQIPARAQRQLVGAVVSAQAFGFHISGTISRFEFLEGTNLVAVAGSVSMTVEITLTRAGVLEFRAEVVNSTGERFVSQPLRVCVAESLNTPLVPALLGAQADAWSSYVIATNGELYACGRNDHGQLGLGTTNASQPFFSAVPRPGNVQRWIGVAVGAGHALGIADTGELHAWGDNRSGQLGLGYTNEHELGPVLVPRPSGVTAWQDVRAGAGHSLALAEDGRLFGWGANGQGQLGLGHTNDVATAALVPPPEGVAGWISIAAAAYHSAGVAASGELYVWGFSATGSLVEGYTNAVPAPTRIPRPAGVSRWVSVAAGGVFNLALADNGQLYSWGLNAGGLLGLGDRSTNLPVVVPAPEAVELPAGVTAWTRFAAGQDHSLAVGSDGQLYAWGANNSSGELGTGEEWWSEPVRSSAPVIRPASVTLFKAFTAGNQFSLGIGDDDRLYAWGANGQGQLGNGAPAVALPVFLPAPVCSLDLFCPGITNLLPTIAILSPPTGTKLYSPANCEVVVQAADLDGVVDEVELFMVRQVVLAPETNRVGRLTAPPYRFDLTNLTSAVRSLFARVTDNSGARVETPARYLTIFSSPSLSYVPLPTNAVPNPFTGFIEQRVSFQNASTLPVAELRLMVTNLTDEMTLANAFGETNGTPYVEHAFAVAPGERVTFTLEYHVPPGQPLPSPRFSATLVTPESIEVQTGELTGLSLWLIPPGGGYGLEFPSQAGVSYAVQYSTDLRNWQTSEPDASGDGGFVRWLDQGPPRTSRPPTAESQRFYRVLQLP